MKSTLLVFLVIMAAIIESFGLPYISLFHIALPLVGLSLIVSIPYLSRGAGLGIATIAGLIVDANSAGLFGLFGAYYLLFALLTRQITHKADTQFHQTRSQIQVAEAVIVIVMAAAAPIWQLVATFSSVQTPRQLSGLLWLLLIRLALFMPAMYLILRTKKTMISI